MEKIASMTKVIKSIKILLNCKLKSVFLLLFRGGHFSEHSLKLNAQKIKERLLLKQDGETHLSLERTTLKETY